MAATGVPEIDALYASRGAPPVTQASGRAAVGVVWDLLRGHAAHPAVSDAVARTRARWRAAKKKGPTPGLGGLPLEGSVKYGDLGDPWRAQLTFAALEAFRGHPPDRLADAPAWRVDHDTLVRLSTPAGGEYRPLATRVYLTHVVGKEWKQAWLLSLVAQHEGRGDFSALNANTDGAGLSVGLIQWAQSPGRLGELVQTIFASADDRVKAARVAAFGTDSAVHDLLVRHTRAATGADGIFRRDWSKKARDDRDAGRSRIRKEIDLLSADWLARFRRALRDPALQGVQVERALQDFERDDRAMRRDADLAATLTSHRARAFLQDLANQHGPVGKAGKPGARLIFRKAWDALLPADRNEENLMKRMEEESLAILARLFRPDKTGAESPFVRAGRARREFFRLEVDASVFPQP
jgi:hypothetical protein